METVSNGQIPLVAPPELHQIRDIKQMQYKGREKKHNEDPIN
jgi:hypothetical protein